MDTLFDMTTFASFGRRSTLTGVQQQLLQALAKHATVKYLARQRRYETGGRDVTKAALQLIGQGLAEGTASGLTLTAAGRAAVGLDGRLASAPAGEGER